MDELAALVERAKAGDLDAFGGIVGRFQDMALGYAYSVVGDFHLAEDVAQEAFVEAYRALPALREPAAFPGWFRRIVFKHCDRTKRRRELQSVPLESVAEVASDDAGPAAVAERREMRRALLDAISALPERERTVVTLFYINGYTQNEVAEFLELPVTTVNNRLHASRTRLKERMIRMVDDELKTHGLPKEFPERIRTLLALPRPLTIEGHPVRDLWLAFRSCFPGFEEVELDEICERKVSMLDPEVARTHVYSRVYSIDERRILRPELTSQMASRWIEKGGGPCRLMTAGRVFRADADTETETRLEVFHQAEVLWAEEGLDMVRFDETVRRAAAQMLPGLDLRGVPFSWPFLRDGTKYEARWRDSWTSVAAGGIAKDEWSVKAGLDPSGYGVIGFAFGLERCVQVSLDVDDIRTLWRPPYVPQSSR